MLVKEQVKQTLGELLTLEYGTGLPEPMRTGEGFPVYGSSGLVGRHAHSIAQGPGIIVGRKGTVGAIIWSVDDFWPIDTTYYVKARANYSLRWLYWCLSSLPLKNLDSSTGVPGLNRHDIYAVEVNVPSLPEQRRIAEILDTVDAAIQQTEALIAKLKQMKAGLLHDLLTRGLDAHGHLRDPVAHPEQFKDSPRGRIPQAWEVVKVREICNLGRGRVISQLDLDRHPGQYPVYSSQSKDEGVFGYMDTFDFEGEYVTWTTDGAYAGAVFHRSGRFNCTNVCGTLRPKDAGLNMRFLAVTLATRTRKHVSYVGNPKLMNNIMAEISIPLPPSKEQGAVAAVLDTQETRISIEEAYRDKLKQLKKGLMADLLTGRVRVTGEEATG